MQSYLDSLLVSYMEVQDLDFATYVFASEWVIECVSLSVCVPECIRLIVYLYVCIC